MPDRTGWNELPEAIRHWVEQVLESAVTATFTALGGFSLGAACRLRTQDGRTAFLKATSNDPNPISADLLRREAGVTPHLKGDPAAARILGVFDDGTWIAMLSTHVDGRHPVQPWDRAELARVLAALASLHDRHTPTSVPGLPSLRHSHVGVLDGWGRLAADGTRFLDPWSRRHIDRLVELESGWQDAAEGETLLHADLRADNVILGDHAVVFVDWSWACLGNAFFDVVALAPSVAAQGGPGPEWLLSRTPRAGSADPGVMASMVAAVAGYFTDQARRPPPPHLQNPRASQAAQARAARQWLRDLTGWR